MSSNDNLPSEVYYIVINGAKQYFTDYNRAEKMARELGVGSVYTEDDPDEIADLYEVGYIRNSRRPIKSDRYQEDVLETYLTPAYAEDRLYDDLYDCQKHNYLVRKYFKEGLRGDDLINAVTDSINDDIADWDVTAWQGLEEEGDMFDPQDVYNGMEIQNSRKSSRKPVKSSVEGLTFDNKYNDGSNDFVQYKVNNQNTLDKIKEYLEYDVDELKLGNVYVSLMYDNNKLVAAQVVDTESSTWDLSPEECIEIFGSDIMTNVSDNVGNHAVDEFTDYDVDPLHFVVGKTMKDGSKLYYCEDNRFYDENDYSRPDIKVFDNEVDAKKIAKHSKNGFAMPLEVR